MTGPADVARRSSALAQRLRIRQLQVIVAIAEQRSLLAASRSLGISQPALSKALQEIEDTLGVRIFDRMSRGVVPNAYGQAILIRARTVLAELNRIGDDLVQIAQQSAGTVVIGALPTAAAGILPATLARLRARHPRLGVKVLQGRTHDLLPLLESGGLDVVVGRLYPPDTPDDFHREVLYDEPISVLARAGHPIFESGADGALAAYDLVLPSLEQRMGQEVDQVLGAFGDRLPKPLLRASSLSFIRELILSGDGLAILPRLTMAGDLLRGTIRVVPVEIQTPRRPAGLITLRHRARSPGLTALEAALRDYLAEARSTGLFDTAPEVRRAGITSGL
ncbi:MAG TPA: LysR substrate-binding domain-containing protein [Microvirga sp.]|nr:LysR substrate-binding domain-containing protein [Microvirga sp.]